MVSNNEQVGRGLDLLVDGLAPFVERVLVPHVPPGHDWTVILAAKDAVNGASPATYSVTDPQDILRVLTERLGTLAFPFTAHLGRAERNLAGELREVRNRWAHKGAFSADDAYRGLDTMERLLRAVGAVPQADQVKVLRLDVQRTAYEIETRRATRSAAHRVETGDAELPSWRDVLAPHSDVQNGTYAASEFAADLFRVAHADPELESEYADPIVFFRRTHLTGGLRDLLTRVADRVNGNETANAVINLQDRFGGGKTHSMLAVWHLLSGRPLHDFPQEVQDLLGSVDPTGATVRRVAIVGNEIPPGEQKPKPDGTVVRTIWGEIAWQLGGADGYAMVAGSDENGTNPGALLRDLLARYGPAVILIDEWVAYARQLYGRTGLPSGDFETQFTFAQSLTQAAAAVPGCLLLVSVPASDVRLSEKEGTKDVQVSDLEIGGEHGRAALERLDNIVRRVAHPWEPATPDESFEIVRRRLFREPDNEATAAINAAARRFVDYYRQNLTEFPTGSGDRAYENRIRASYPLHPELLDRLYGDWSTLERFQRTRGVLRLMSGVVHHLWQRQDPSPMILPGSVPLDAAGARSEVVQYVEPRWAEIIEADVDGDNAVAGRIDTDRQLLGRRSTALRTARTVLFDSAPTLGSARKGVDRKRIAIGVAMPGDVVGNIGSALDGLLNESSHLFRDGDRWWYDTQPSLNRLAAERARELPLDRIHAEVITRLTQAARGSHPEFSDVLVAPETSAEIPDDVGTRLVLLRPDYRHNGKDKESTAARFAVDVLQRRGTAPRLRPNTVIMLAADESRWKDLESTVRQYLAWRSISNDASLDLTRSNALQAQTRTEETNRRIDDQVGTTWIWALHAVQDDPQEPMTVGQVKCEGTGRVPVRAGAKLMAADVVRTELAPAALQVELTGRLRARWNTGSVSVGELWDWYTRYPYLVRLRDRSVLTASLRDVLRDAAWATKGFALATGLDESTGDFVGLAVPLEDLDFGAIEDSTLLVRPDLATEQRARERAAKRSATRVTSPGQEQTTATAGRPVAIGGSGSDSTGEVSEQGSRPHVIAAGSYSGRYVLEDPEADISALLGQVGREVLQLLANVPDLDLFEIAVDVRAEVSGGFPEQVQRAVKENTHVLRFDRSHFDDVEY